MIKANDLELDNIQDHPRAMLLSTSSSKNYPVLYTYYLEGDESVPNLLLLVDGKDGSVLSCMDIDSPQVFPPFEF